MKIHFVAAISQREDYGVYYDRIMDVFKHNDWKLVADHIVGKDLDRIMHQTDEEKVEHYKKVMKWVGLADLVVAEASFPSTVHVGHEISLALEKGKPVVVLYKEGRAPVFLQGLESERLVVEEYNDSNLERVLMDSIKYASEQQDTRFNFFISPRIGTYLDWVAKHKRIPRAVYLRKLIERDMQNNQEED